MQSESFGSVLGRLLLIAGAIAVYRWWRGDYEEKPQLNPEIKFDWRDATKDRWKDSPYILPVLNVEPKKDQPGKLQIKGSNGLQPWQPVGLDPALLRPIDPDLLRKVLKDRPSSP